MRPIPDRRWGAERRAREPLQRQIWCAKHGKARADGIVRMGEGYSEHKVFARVSITSPEAPASGFLFAGAPEGALCCAHSPKAIAFGDFLIAGENMTLNDTIFRAYRSQKQKPPLRWLLRHGDYLFFPVGLALLLLMWQGLVSFYHYPPFVLPSPSEVARRGVLMLRDGSLMYHTIFTLKEIFLGLALGLAAATTIGYALAKVNTLVGIRSVDKDLRDLMRSLKASCRQTLTMLEIPASMPVLLGGFKVSVTLAVIGAVVGEFIGADRGLGFLINVARGTLDTPLLFVVIFTLVIIALVMYLGVLMLERILLRWQRAR